MMAADPFPSDGPLCRALQDGIDNAATRLLKNPPLDTRIGQFIEQLQSASKKQQQLQALQAFRARWLQGKVDQDAVRIQSLAQVLLEVACAAPPALRKAVYSCLDVLPFETTPLVHALLEDDVLSCWKHPVQVLHHWLVVSPLKVDPPSDELLEHWVVEQELSLPDRLLLAEICKVHPQEPVAPFLWSLLHDPAVPHDALVTIALAYVRCYPDPLALNLTTLPPLPASALWLGLATIAPDTVPREPILQLARSAQDPQVRVHAYQAMLALWWDESWILPVLELLLETNDETHRKVVHLRRVLWEHVWKHGSAQLLEGVVERLVERQQWDVVALIMPHVKVEQLQFLLQWRVDESAQAGARATVWIQAVRRVNDPSLWVPTVVEQLLDPGQRKRAAAWILPKLGSLYEPVLDYLVNLSPPVYERSSRTLFADRVVWAKCELIRVAAKDGVLKDTAKLAVVLPREDLEWALTHFDPLVRCVAVQAMSTLVEAYSPNGSVMDRLRDEEELWRYILPWTLKTSGKEYTSSILYCLLSFLDRLSMAEAEDPIGGRLPRLEAFFVEFLVGDILVRKAAYPGSVVDKELFALSLMECSLSFIDRDLDVAMESVLLPKTGAIFQRRRSDAEDAAMYAMRKALLSHDVVTSLFAMLNSVWDNVRASSYHMLSSLMSMARLQNLALPETYTCPTAVLSLTRKSLFLVSSPRQREADTGAKMMGFLCLSEPTEASQLARLQYYVDHLVNRLEHFKSRLGKILSSHRDEEDGNDLPLVHGLVGGVSLCIESLSRSGMRGSSTTMELSHTLVCALSDALRVSLAVISDVEKDDLADATEVETRDLTVGVEAKVNAGAIGANGLFSSVERLTLEEKQKRVALQRLVMGSWLLNREASLALGSVFTLRFADLSLDIVNETGLMLLRTLSSVKHTGAAHASNRALQALAAMCFSSIDSGLSSLPRSWSDRLLDEIAGRTKTKDSTLRRSTGFSLGLCAIMKAEMTVPSRDVSTQVLERLLHLAVPNAAEQAMPATIVEAIDDKSDSVASRTRVHALNALRLIILDAVLASVVKPIVGHAITASLIGYVDPDWGVRNSSTMVFSAVMLRAIDADKNATEAATSKARTTGLDELLRLHPQLLDLFKSSLRWSEKTNGSSLPPSFPVVLLLARVRPARLSGSLAAKHSDDLMPDVLIALEQRHLAIRKGAARAVANLAVAEPVDSHASYSSVLVHCSGVIQPGVARCEWNAIHGALLCILELIHASPKEVSSLVLDLLGTDRFVEIATDH